MLPPYPIVKDNFVKKIFSYLWTKYFCVIDPHAGWIVTSVLKAIKVIKKNEIDVIIATAPPFSVLFAAAITSMLTRKN